MATSEMHPDLTGELAAIADTLRRSTTQVRGRGPGGGAGVIWQPDGLVITNAHVARGDAATVETHDGRVLDAEIVARDRSLDLAALRIDARDLPAAAVGDSDALRVGELVLAVGNPLGITNAVSAGIVHAVSASGQGRNDWVRADVRLLPGNSGGPLANAAGQVIGINSMVAGGLGLAVPSNVVERFLGRQSRPQLGIAARPVLVPLGRERVAGLLLMEVVAGSAAEAAGLLIGDVLIGADGQAFRDPRDLSRLSFDRDRPLGLDLIRGGRRLTLSVDVVPPEQEAA